MGLLLSLVPWIVFLVLIEVDIIPAIISAIIALVTTLVLQWRDIVRHPKLLDLGTVGFFVGMVGLLLLVDAAIIKPWVPFLSDFTLFGIVMGSIVARQPFTLQYAREQAPPDYWDHPDFLALNYVLSQFWAGAFAASSVGALLIFVLPPEDVWISELIRLGALGVAAAFTAWYPNYVEKRAEAAAQASQDQPTPEYAED